VISPSDGSLYGMILATAPEAQESYLIPAYTVFDSVRSRLPASAIMTFPTSSDTNTPRDPTQLPKLIGISDLPQWLEAGESWQNLRQDHNRHPDSLAAAASGLIAEAEMAEDIGDAMRKFKLAVGDQAEEVTTLVSELYTVGSALREIDAASNSPDYSHNLRDLQDDLDLVRNSLRYTLDDVFLILGKMGNGAQLLTLAAYNQTWRDIVSHFQRGGGARLSFRLETYRLFLLALCSKLRRSSLLTLSPVDSERLTYFQKRVRASPI
jgi:hypothetical protein